MKKREILCLAIFLKNPYDGDEVMTMRRSFAKRVVRFLLKKNTALYYYKGMMLGAVGLLLYAAVQLRQGNLTGTETAWEAVQAAAAVASMAFGGGAVLLFLRKKWGKNETS